MKVLVTKLIGINEIEGNAIKVCQNIRMDELNESLSELIVSVYSEALITKSYS